MSFATLTNVVTMMFCAAVLIQSVRMMRSLETVKKGALTQVVEALDKSTSQAREVLREMKAALIGCADNERLVAQGKDMAEELSVMIGIANATAERLLETASAANTPAPLELVPDAEAPDDLEDGELEADCAGALKKAAA